MTADIPEEVTAAMGRLRQKLYGRPSVVSVGLVYDGDRWSVAVWRRGPYDVNDRLTDIDGVRVWDVFINALPDVEE